MRQRHLVAATAILISFGISAAPAVARDGRGRSRETVEKTFSVGNEVRRLRAAVTDDCSAIEIVDSGDMTQQGSTEGATNRVAHVTISALAPEAYDFALSRTGRILWLVVPRNDVRLGGHVHTVYPLLRNDETHQYAFARRQHSVAAYQERSQHAAVLSSFSLTKMLREIGVALWKKGSPIALGRGTMVCDLRIECPEGESAIVSGRLGAKYSFTGEVGLGTDHRVWAKDFEIIEIGQQEDLTK